MPHVVTETVENNEFLKRFKNFDIIAIKKDNDEFVAVANEITHVFQEKVFEEANPFSKNSN